MAAPVRLQRYLAAAGVSARRKAEELITAGRVKVNGAVVRVLGTKVDPDEDQVEVDGQAVVALDNFYVLLNKPKACITAVTDDRDRPTVMDYLPNVPVPVKPVGRLDFYTEGVLLLTNDGELAARLLAPANHVPKTYHVKVRGQIGGEHLKALREGVTLDDGTVTMPAEVEQLPGESKHTWLAITIHEGKHRQIHRMIEALGSQVDKLQRVAFANLTFHDLRVGDARELGQQELNELRDLVGLDHSAVARGAWRSDREDTDIPRRARAKARAEAEAELAERTAADPVLDDSYDELPDDGRDRSWDPAAGPGEVRPGASGSANSSGGSSGGAGRAEGPRGTGGARATARPAAGGARPGGRPSRRPDDRTRFTPDRGGAGSARSVVPRAPGRETVPRAARSFGTFVRGRSTGPTEGGREVRSYGARVAPARDDVPRAARSFDRPNDRAARTEAPPGRSYSARGASDRREAPGGAGSRGRADDRGPRPPGRGDGPRSFGRTEDRGPGPAGRGEARTDERGRSGRGEGRTFGRGHVPRAVAQVQVPRSLDDRGPRPARGGDGPRSFGGRDDRGSRPSGRGDSPRSFGSSRGGGDGGSAPRGARTSGGRPVPVHGLDGRAVVDQVTIAERIAARVDRPPDQVARDARWGGGPRAAAGRSFPRTDARAARPRRPKAGRPDGRGARAARGDGPRGARPAGTPSTIDAPKQPRGKGFAAPRPKSKATGARGKRR